MRSESSLQPASAAILPPPGSVRQVQVLVQDAAGFVNRGLAVLWREQVSGDLAARQTEAIALIARDELAALKRLLLQAPELVDYREAGAEGFLLLHHAARLGSAEALRLLVEQGAPLEAPSGHLREGEGGFMPGLTPLLVAVEHGLADQVRTLLALGARAAAQQPASGLDALQLAAQQGREDLLEVLIQGGAPLDAFCPHQSFDEQLGLHRLGSALHIAARAGHVGCVRLLLRAGAPRDLAGEDGCTALHQAAALGATAVLEALLAAGADPQGEAVAGADGLDQLPLPLLLAARNGHLAAAQLLLVYGAAPACRDPASGLSAAELAARGGHSALAELLEQARAGVLPSCVLSKLDDRYIDVATGAYAELLPFLQSLLAEFPLEGRSLLVLSDWLAEALGPDNRPHLARACRERAAGGAG